MKHSATFNGEIKMTKLHVFSGFPGVGKSTAAREFAEQLKNSYVVETDAVALELIQERGWPEDQNDWERHMWGILHTTSQIRAIGFLSAGYNVIYDATNLRQSDHETFRGIADRTHSTSEFHYIPPPALDEWRRRLQDRPEGEIYWWNVITRMAKDSVIP